MRVVRILLLAAGLSAAAVVTAFWLQARHEAEFFATHDQSDCAPHAVRWGLDCTLLCKRRELDFMRRCLVRAKPRPDFCREVPRAKDAADDWIVQQCFQERGHASVCLFAYLVVVQYCGGEL
jgi:hypothetical protein